MIILTKVIEKFLIILIIVSVLSPSISYGQISNVDKYSKSSILIDQDTGRVLYEKNPDDKRPLASLSKMMTFLIAIEAINNKEVNKEDIIVVDKDIAKVRGSSYHLKVGEKVPLDVYKRQEIDEFDEEIDTQINKPKNKIFQKVMLLALTVTMLITVITQFR